MKKLFDDFSALWETDFDDIWNIDITQNLLIALNGWLCRKGDYGRKIENLTSAEKVFYLVFQLEGEVNNGGFAQFLYNSSGDFTNDTSDALREIGAYRTLEIYDRMLAALGGIVPTDRNEREKMLDGLFTDEIDETLDQCDTAFYQSPDDLSNLCYQFILSRREQFCR